MKDSRILFEDVLPIKSVSDRFLLKDARTKEKAERFLREEKLLVFWGDNNNTKTRIYIKFRPDEVKITDKKIIAYDGKSVIIKWARHIDCISVGTKNDKFIVIRYEHLKDFQ